MITNKVWPHPLHSITHTSYTRSYYHSWSISQSLKIALRNLESSQTAGSCTSSSRIFFTANPLPCTAVSRSVIASARLLQVVRQPSVTKYALDWPTKYFTCHHTLPCFVPEHPRLQTTLHLTQPRHASMRCARLDPPVPRTSQSWRTKSRVTPSTLVFTVYLHLPCADIFSPYKSYSAKPLQLTCNHLHPSTLFLQPLHRNLKTTKPIDLMITSCSIRLPVSASLCATRRRFSAWSLSNRAVNASASRNRWLLKTGDKAAVISLASSWPHRSPKNMLLRDSFRTCPSQMTHIHPSRNLRNPSNHSNIF